MSKDKKDKEETKLRIIAAVGEQLAKKGFRDLGVNSISREADVDKVLIYRYFGGLPELLKAYSEEGDYWPTAQELIGENPEEVPANSAADWLIHIFGRVQLAIHQRPITKEILRWEIVDRNDLIHEFAAVRSRVALECLAFINERHPFPAGLDAMALSSVLLSGMIYVTLRTEKNPNCLGMDLSDPVTIDRLNAMVSFLVHQAIGN